MSNVFWQKIMVWRFTSQGATCENTLRGSKHDHIVIFRESASARAFSRTDTRFSHGLCPDCAGERCPEYADAVIKGKRSIDGH